MFNPEYKYFKMGPEHFFDLNLTYDSPGKKGPSLSLYVKNLFNNDDNEFFIPLSGTGSERARSFGVKLSYTF